MPPKSDKLHTARWRGPSEPGNPRKGNNVLTNWRKSAPKRAKISHIFLHEAARCVWNAQRFQCNPCRTVFWLLCCEVVTKGWKPSQGETTIATLRRCSRVTSTWHTTMMTLSSIAKQKTWFLMTCAKLLMRQPKLSGCRRCDWFHSFQLGAFQEHDSQVSWRLGLRCWHTQGATLWPGLAGSRHLYRLLFSCRCDLSNCRVNTGYCPAASVANPKRCCGLLQGKGAPRKEKGIATC